MRYHLTPVWEALSTRQVISVGKVVEKEEPSFTAAQNVNWYSHCGKQNGGVQKLRIVSLCTPLGIYLTHLKIFVHKDICTPMLIAVLFTVAKTWKQPSAGLNKKHMVHTHICSRILLRHKKRWNSAICNNMASWECHNNDILLLIY